MKGRKTSCPAALPAVRMPITRPRLRANQVLAMVAAKTRAIEPVPSPISSPHVSRICQDWFTRTVSALPAPISTRATAVTARMPKRSIRAAANGAVRPKSTRLMLTAAESTVVDQPNSFCSGTISTPGAARKPAAPTSARNATAATIQAGCSRRLGAGRRVDLGALMPRFRSARRPGGRGLGEVARGTGPAVRVRLCQLVLSAVSRSPQAVQVSAEDVRAPQPEWITNMWACSDGAGRCFSAQSTTALSTGRASSPLAVRTYSWRVRPPSS